MSWHTVYNVSRAPSTCAAAFRIHGKNCFVVTNVSVTGRVLFFRFFFDRRKVATLLFTHLQTRQHECADASLAQMAVAWQAAGTLVRRLCLL